VSQHPPLQPGYTWRPPPPIPLAPNGQPLASFGDRFLAYLLDALIMGAVALIWTVPMLVWFFSVFWTWMSDAQRLHDADPSARPELPGMGPILVAYLVFIAVTIVLSMAVSYLYLVEYQLRKGQTIGKRAMKLRVIPVDPAATLTRMDLLKRWAVERVAANFVPGLSLIDGLWQLWDKPLQQCLHDKAAGTVVVKTG
jgi:uncharacterized RDD family membrane protein YckC